MADNTTENNPGTESGGLPVTVTVPVDPVGTSVSHDR